MNDSTTVQRCSKCGIEYPATLEFFGKHKEKKNGLQSWCKNCKRVATREYMRKKCKTEEHKAKKRAWYQTPKGQAQRQRSYEKARSQPDYKERRRAQYRNPHIQERIKAYNSRPEIKERIRATNRVSSKRYRESAKGRESRIRINANRRGDPNYRALTKVHYQKRQARKRELPDTLTTEQWQRTLDYFGGCCAVCGRPKGLWHTLAVDHWIPLSDSNCPGTVASNCVPLCHGDLGCNNSKVNRNAEEWLIERYGKKKAKEILKRIEAFFDIAKTW